ncbi:putative pterin-4-alpha-carbinolamine dehydratase [Styela clava]
MTMARLALFTLVIVTCVGVSYSERDFMDPLVNCLPSQQPEKLTTKKKEVLEPLIKEGWATIEKGTKLHKKYTFEEFADAFSFMTKVALKAEAVCHHPNWTNTYKTVEVILFTWGKGGITMSDVELAKFMDDAAVIFLKRNVEPKRISSI